MTFTDARGLKRGATVQAQQVNIQNARPALGLLVSYKPLASCLNCRSIDEYFYVSDTLSRMANGTGTGRHRRNSHTRRGPDARRQTLGACLRGLYQQNLRRSKQTAKGLWTGAIRRRRVSTSNAVKSSYSPREGRRGSGSGTSKRPPASTPAGTVTVMSWPVVGARTRTYGGGMRLRF